MPNTYSTHQAKAQFSELLRQMREHGETVTVTYRGKPVAEIKPVRSNSPERDTNKPQTTEERLDELRCTGQLVGSGKPRKPFVLGEPCPGALERFLAGRD